MKACDDWGIPQERISALVHDNARNMTAEADTAPHTTSPYQGCIYLVEQYVLHVRQAPGTAMGYLCCSV